MTIEERLRNFGGSDDLGDGDFSICDEAADLIASLREQVKRVQSAAKTIMIHEADELRRLREGAQEAHLAKLTLDSEREANARLTDEVESLLAERDALREALEGVAKSAGELPPSVFEQYAHRTARAALAAMKEDHP